MEPIHVIGIDENRDICHIGGLELNIVYHYIYSKLGMCPNLGVGLIMKEPTLSLLLGS